ncbi:endolytic transglycosylase MltG [Nocardioides sp.]|uniref:endolytic transglycosylase MltG n=1 Tax=Nocardioides sp. TaxID=35761 RepID=UPI0039E2B10E
MTDGPEPRDIGDTAERPAVRDLGATTPSAEEPEALAPLLGEEPAEDDYYEDAGKRRAEKSSGRLPGCLAALVALALIAGGLFYAGSWVKDKLDSALSGSSDYNGQSAHGSVTFEVHEGDSAAQIGRNLKSAGVVSSVDAFISAASGNPEAAGIQVGFYQLQLEMKATDALDVLVDPANLITNTVTIPEGLRASDIVAILAKKTDFAKADFQAALKDSAIGLPDYAGGDPEGYLFPATYAFGPDEQPVDMIKDMVTRWKQSATSLDLVAKAGQASAGYTPSQIMTVASLVQSEGKTPEDMAKIARVIYNRIEQNGIGGTVGKLEIDATVDYALGRKLTVGITNEDKQVDSAYNTYAVKGLPPGPISNPGDAAIEAALNPADGDWAYYVTVNLATGETKFATTYDEFLTYRNELRDYCANESAGAC